jgi:hypothetical protein
MSRNHGNDARGTVTAAAPSQHADEQIEDRLQQWRSDLQMFVTGTRSKLELIAKSIAQRPALQPPTAEPADSKAIDSVIAVTSHATLDPTPPTTSAFNIETTADAVVDRIKSSAAGAADLDLADRLSAIKLRLARQLQKT